MEFNELTNFTDGDITVPYGAEGVLTQDVKYTTIFDFAQCIDANSQGDEYDKNYTYTRAQFQEILRSLSSILKIPDFVDPNKAFIVIPKGTQIRFAGFSSPSHIRIDLPLASDSITYITYFVDYVREDLFDYVQWNSNAVAQRN